MSLVDSLSPRQRSGERERERGFQLAAPIRWKGAPLPSPLPARVSQGEGAGGFHDGGTIQMRPEGRYLPCGGPRRNDKLLWDHTRMIFSIYFNPNCCSKGAGFE